jgi:hypothetical protein
VTVRDGHPLTSGVLPAFLGENAVPHMDNMFALIAVGVGLGVAVGLWWSGITVARVFGFLP